MKQNNIFDYIYILIGVPWLFLMIMSSGLYSRLKIILLIILFFVAFAECCITNKCSIKKSFLIIVLIFILYFSLSLCYGILKGYEFTIKNDFSLIQYYIFTPICVVILAKVFSMKDYRVKFIWNLLKYITLLLVILNIVTIIFYRSGISLKILSFIKIYNNQLTNSKLELRITNETSLMFLLPIYIFLLINEKNHKAIYSAIVILGIIYSLLSGRKMLEIIVLFSIIISIAYRIKNSKINFNRLLKNILGICLLLVIFIVILNFISDSLNIDNILIKAKDTLINGLASTAGGIVKRNTNAYALLEMFLNSPIIGNGLNSYDINSIASTSNKWSYEVFYNALLAQTGIIGIIILAVIIIGIITKLYKKYKINGNLIYYSIMVGFISFILCSATNPMIYFVWPWTIALTYIYNSSINKQSE